jgi:hypothetical protein
MRGSRFKSARNAGIAAALLLQAGAFAGCSTFDPLAAKDPEQAAREMELNDPMTRPTQVAWTSARAVHCGFIFDPAQLRANYMAAELQAGNAQMEKIEQAYDYTFQSVSATIKADARYCSKERTAAIRKDLNRYLAGDYTPGARMAR